MYSNNDDHKVITCTVITMTRKSFIHTPFISYSFIHKFVQIIQNPFLYCVMFHLPSKMSLLVFIHSWDRPLWTTRVNINAHEILFNVHAHYSKWNFQNQEIWTIDSLRNRFTSVKILQGVVQLI